MTARIDSNFIQAIEKSWCRETAYPEFQDDYDSRHPSYGQCFVTSLVTWAVNGGTVVTGHTNTDIWHFRNEINGKTIDLTWQQFAKGTKFNPANTIENRILMQRAFNDSTLYKRLQLLIRNMNEHGFSHPNLRADAVLRHYKLSHPHIFRENTPQPLRLNRR